MIFLALLLASSLASPFYEPWQYGLLSNGWPGSLNFNQTTTLQYDNAALPSGSPGDVETCDIANLVYRYNTWYTKFHRPLADQWYYALIDSSLLCLHGHFSNPGDTILYEFDGEQGTPSLIGSTSPVDVLDYGFFRYNAARQWTIFANGVPGSLWIRTWTDARIQFDNAVLPYGTINTSVEGEPLGNFSYVWKYNKWMVHFYRPSTQQWFSGFFDYQWNYIYGDFVGPDGTSHPLWGGPAYSPAEALFSYYVQDYNRWGILANGWPGSLTITSLTSATLVFDDRPVDPLGVPGPNETITNFTFHSNSNWLFNYIIFYRPLAQQTFIGIFDINFANLRGWFIQEGNYYPWVGLNLNEPL